MANRFYLGIRRTWGAAEVAQGILPAIDQELLQFSLRFGGCGGGEWDPLHLFVAGLVFDGQAGEKLSITAPEPPNWVLAVVANLGVGMAT